MVMPAVDNFNYDTAAGDGTLSLTKPSNVAVGDLLMIFVTLENSSSSSQISTPSGFTLKFDVGTRSTDCYALVYYRVADGTEAGSVSITMPGADSGAGWYMRVTGVETSVAADIFGDDFDEREYGSTNLAFVGKVDIDSADSATGRDRLGFSLASTDGGDQAPGFMYNSGNSAGDSGDGWDHVTTSRAATHTNLVNANQYLSHVTDSTGDGGAWTTQERTGTTSVKFIRWLTATSDGLAAVNFFLNGKIATEAEVKHYNGTAFATAPVKHYNGSTWITLDADKLKHWDGSSWTAIN